MGKEKYLNRVQEYFDQTTCMYAFDQEFQKAVDGMDYIEATESLCSLVCRCRTEEQYDFVNATVIAILGWSLDTLVSQAEQYPEEEGGKRT